jgi:hypothetical protein
MKIAAKLHGAAGDPCCCGGPVALVGQYKSGVAPFCGFEEFTAPATPKRWYRKKVKRGTITLQRFAASSDCATGTPTTPATLQCRTRGGTGSLIGYLAFYAETPPNRYLLATWSGGGYKKYWRDWPCVGNLQGSFTYAQSGSYSIDPVTGVQTGGTVFSTNGVPTAGYGPTDNRYAQVPQCMHENPYGGISSPTVGNAIVVGCDTDQNAYREWNLHEYETLCNPDTEANAIARLFAGSAGTWSGYSAGSSTTCLARFQQRTTTTTFVYQEAQFKVTKTGLQANTAYAVHVDLMRRAYGIGDYAKSQTLVVGGTTDGGGNLEIDDQAVPNPIGFESYVTNAVVLLEADTVDTWDETNEYVQTPHSSQPTTCDLTQVDNSTRSVGGVQDLAGPVEADYNGLTIDTTTATTRTRVGNETCTNSPRYDGDPYPWVKMTGTFTETLETEDTPDDAIARATPPLTWADCNTLGWGVRCSTFRIRSDAAIAFRTVHVKAVCTGLGLNTNYRVTIPFAARVLGTAGPFTPTGDSTAITFNSGAQTTYTSDFYDVPMDDGWETVYGSAKMELT